MGAKVVDPKPDALMADDHTALCQKVLDVSSTQGEAVIGLDGIGNNFTGKRNPFKRGRDDGVSIRDPVAGAPSRNYLAIPLIKLIVARRISASTE